MKEEVRRGGGEGGGCDGGGGRGEDEVWGDGGWKGEG